MTKRLFIFVCVFAAVTAQAASYDKTLAHPSGITKTSDTKPTFGVHYGPYLSDFDKQDILGKYIRKEVIKQYIEDTIEANLEVEKAPVSFSFPVSFTGTPQSSSDLSTAQVITAGGNVNCYDFRVGDPHPGRDLDDSIKPKAKGQVECEYIHVFGDRPAWVRIEFTMLMQEYRLYGPGGREFTFIKDWPAQYTQDMNTSNSWRVRFPENQRDGQPGTQVFAVCRGESRHYYHASAVYVKASPPFEYEGPDPYFSGVRSAVVNC